MNENKRGIAYWNDESIERSKGSWIEDGKIPAVNYFGVNPELVR